MEPTSLKELLRGIAETEIDAPVTAVVTDSRKVAPGSLFVAIRGERVDGHDFAAGALNRGRWRSSPSTRSRVCRRSGSLRQRMCAAR